MGRKCGLFRMDFALSGPASKQYFQGDGNEIKRWTREAMGRNRVTKVWDESGRVLAAEVVAAQPRRAESPTAEVAIPDIQTSQARSCIFFDWDDTLCPTSFLQQVVLPCLPQIPGQELPRIRKENPFYEELAATAKLIEEVLRAAKKLASVAIITLARRPWLNDVSEACLPGLNLPSLLTELQIPVLYAREHVPMAVANMGSPGAYIRAKRDAMRSCVKQLFGNTANVKGFISIGDSEIEHCALQQLVGSIGASSMMQTPASGMPHCKIVGEPSSQGPSPSDPCEPRPKLKRAAICRSHRTGRHAGHCRFEMAFQKNSDVYTQLPRAMHTTS
ncbi:Ift81 [Symbiodinium natans]|uniref:Ift81 protein n=1 Tax=Symbiodinium natans TaxID=878477 RepID=A0A812JKT9_9DINO|nr:Ift81 [Symbiodinium natans]